MLKTTPEARIRRSRSEKNEVVGAKQVMVVETEQVGSGDEAGGCIQVTNKPTMQNNVSWIGVNREQYR
jgi:hypothetical protein